MVQASRFCKTTPRASRCYGPRPPLSVPLPRVVTGDELGDDGCCLNNVMVRPPGWASDAVLQNGALDYEVRFPSLVIAKTILLTQGGWVVFQMV